MFKFLVLTYNKDLEFQYYLKNNLAKIDAANHCLSWFEDKNISFMDFRSKSYASVHTGLKYEKWFIYLFKFLEIKFLKRQESWIKEYTYFQTAKKFTILQWVVAESTQITFSWFLCRSRQVRCRLMVLVQRVRVADPNFLICVHVQREN